MYIVKANNCVKRKKSCVNSLTLLIPCNEQRDSGEMHEWLYFTDLKPPKLIGFSHLNIADVAIIGAHLWIARGKDGYSKMIC